MAMQKETSPLPDDEINNLPVELKKFMKIDYLLYYEDSRSNEAEVEALRTGQKKIEISTVFDHSKKEQSLNFEENSLRNKDPENPKYKKKGIIKNGAEFADLVHKCYQRTTKTMNTILEKVSPLEAIELITDNDDFLLEAAENLSYPSLQFMIDFGICPSTIDSKFDQKSEILELFLQNLIDKNLSQDEKRNIMIALLYFNKKGVEAAVQYFGNHALANILQETQKYFEDEDPMVDEGQYTNDSLDAKELEELYESQQRQEEERWKRK